MPRCDRDNRKYYCTTILTLFKSWRSGKDLKSENYSWDETFTEYQFTFRQLEIIKYFIIRYECLDAWDNYSKQLRETDISNSLFL